MRLGETWKSPAALESAVGDGAGEKQSEESRTSKPRGMRPGSELLPADRTATESAPFHLQRYHTCDTHASVAWRTGGIGAGERKLVCCGGSCGGEYARA